MARNIGIECDNITIQQQIGSLAINKITDCLTKYMGGPIISPDGKFIWTGEDWIPAPPKIPQQVNIALQDSVHSGDINVIQNNPEDIVNAMLIILENIGFTHQYSPTIVDDSKNQLDEMLKFSKELVADNIELEPRFAETFGNAAIHSGNNQLGFKHYINAYDAYMKNGDLDGIAGCLDSIQKIVNIEQVEDMISSDIENLYSEILKIQKKHNDYPAAVTTLIILSRISVRKGSRKNLIDVHRNRFVSEGYLAEAIVLTTKIGDQRLIVDTKYEYAKLLYESFWRISHTEQFLQFLNGLGDRWMPSSSKKWTVDYYPSSWEFEKNQHMFEHLITHHAATWSDAIEKFEDGKLYFNLDTEPPDNWLMSLDFDEIGVESYKRFKQCLEIYKMLGDNKGMALSHLGMAKSLTFDVLSGIPFQAEMDGILNSLEHYRESMKIFEREGDTLNLAIVQCLYGAIICYQWGLSSTDEIEKHGILEETWCEKTNHFSNSIGNFQAIGKFELIPDWLIEEEPGYMFWGRRSINNIPRKYNYETGIIE